MKFIAFNLADDNNQLIEINASKIVALIFEGESTIIETEGKSYCVEGDIDEVKQKINKQ